MIELRLSNGLVAIIDDEDGRLARYQWTADVDSHTVYARRYSRAGGLRRSFFLHREVLGVTDRRIQVDHINGNGLDCRRANLRTASHADNQRNARRTKNKSGFRGVRRSAMTGRWGAEIRDGAKQRHLGYFDAADEAARAYDVAARRLHGPFATLNFPPASSGTVYLDDGQGLGLPGDRRGT